jgi:hypothetical protein
VIAVVIFIGIQEMLRGLAEPGFEAIQALYWISDNAKMLRDQMRKRVEHEQSSHAWFIFLLRFVIQIALYRSGFIALAADDFGRAIVAARWSVHPTRIWPGVWLPLHAYIIGTALHFRWDLL